MAEREVDYLIVGGGHAGFSAAKALRESGEEGSIVLVSREPDPPYDRTLVTKDYLRGDVARNAAPLAERGWWAEHDVELLGKVSALKLKAEERRVALSNKDVITYGAALLATGANVRRLRVDGSNLGGIHYARTLGNSDAIRDDTGETQHVVLVGGSYIATEVAASLTTLGRTCTLVMQEDVVLERTFGAEVGRYVQGILSEHGITVHGGEEVEAFTGTERVSGVRTKGGLELPAQAVIIGAGVVPDVQLAKAAGLELGESGGILVDERMETSAQGTFAAGDNAEYASGLHPAGRLRVEHWEVAAAQGRRAAAAMRGAELPDEEIPYFFSDLADWLSYEYIGPAYAWDRVVIRGSMDEGNFSAWYLDGGTVAAVLSAGRSEDLDHGRALFGKAVDADALADTDREPAAA